MIRANQDQECLLDYEKQIKKQNNMIANLRAQLDELKSKEDEHQILLSTHRVKISELEAIIEYFIKLSANH